MKNLKVISRASLIMLVALLTYYQLNITFLTQRLANKKTAILQYSSNRCKATNKTKKVIVPINLKLTTSKAIETL
jgi:hypothetical protein